MPPRRSGMHKNEAVLTLSGPVHSVPSPEFLRVGVCQFVQFIPEQNVVLRLVGENEGQLGGVLFVLHHLAHQLQHGSYASTAWRRKNDIQRKENEKKKKKMKKKSLDMKQFL